MPYHLRVYRVVCRMAERQIIYRIEHIRLAHTVLAYETIDLRRQFQGCLRDVFVVYQRQFFENHCAKVAFFSHRLHRLTQINNYF